MKITAVGIDLAKNVFQVHGVDERGKAVLRKQLRRAQIAVFFGNLPPCVIGIEACASAHHWGRTLQRLGHTVRLMAPQFVKRYVKTNKNDAADAEVFTMMSPTSYPKCQLRWRGGRAASPLRAPHIGTT
jgi:transposase